MAAIRMANLSRGNGKRSAERHAKREDAVSLQRSIGDPSRNYAWSKAGFGVAGGGCDIVRAHDIHKAETGAEERANTSPAMHLLAVEAYITATLRKILDQHMQSDIVGLMSWNFGKQSSRSMRSDGRGRLPSV